MTRGKLRQPNSRRNRPKYYRAFDLGRNPGDFSAECTYHYDDQGRIVVTDMVTRKEVEWAEPVFTIETEIGIRDTRMAARLL